MKHAMRNLALAALTAAGFSLAACGTTVQPAVLSCPLWPNEGDAAYREIQNACGGSEMPLCPNHREWRWRLRNLKDQLAICATDQLSGEAGQAAPAPLDPMSTPPPQ